jgi:uncharacterized protein involved in tellurium resistance
MILIDADSAVQVQAIFSASSIDTNVGAFRDLESGVSAWEQLLVYVEEYFRKYVREDDAKFKVHRTYAPPIYLQYPGHSITIIGLETRHDHTKNLLVFDPIFKTAPAMHRLLGRQNIRTPRPEVIDAYRRGYRQLSRHGDFECLMSVSTIPSF